MIGALNNLLSKRTDLLALLTLLVAVIPRVLEAATTYINPDESSYFTMGVAESLAELHQRSTRTHHPPLLVFVLHAVSRVSHSELALRIVPLLAGVAFPWFFYRWLGLVWNKTAGYLALLFLAFAPYLISLSAQARAYTLALLGIGISLHLLERALREVSVRWLALSALALYGAILSEYFTAFFAGGAGIYFLLRVRTIKPNPTFLGTWVASQLGGVAICVLLFFTHIREIADTGSSSGALNGFLRHGFPWPETNSLIFLIKGVAKQSTYIFASVPLGLFMLIPFVVGIWFLWRGRSPDDATQTRPVIALALLPFVFAAAGSFLHAFPLLDSRHTVLLGVFMVLLVSLPLAKLASGREWIILPGALLIIPFWHSIAITDTHNIGPHRHKKEFAVAAAAHLRLTIPPGAIVLCDRETRLIIDYYFGPNDAGASGWAHRTTGPEWNNHLRMVAYRYAFRNHRSVQEDIVRLRADYGLPEGKDIWLLEGGWFFRHFRSPDFQKMVVSKRSFGDALAVFRLRPDADMGQPAAR